MKARVIVLGLVLVAGACTDDDANPIFTSTTGSLAVTTSAPPAPEASATTEAPTVTAELVPTTTATTTEAPTVTGELAPTTTTTTTEALTVTAELDPTITAPPECLGRGEPPPPPKVSDRSSVFGDFDGDGTVLDEVVVYRGVGDEWFLWLGTTYGFGTEISLGFEPNGEAMAVIAAADLGLARELAIVRTENPPPTPGVGDVESYQFYEFIGARCAVIVTWQTLLKGGPVEFIVEVGPRFIGLNASLTCHTNGTVQRWQRTTTGPPQTFRHVATAFEANQADITTWTELGVVVDDTTGNPFPAVTGSAISQVTYSGEDDIVASC